MRSPEFFPHPQSPKEPAVDTDSPSDETTPRKPSRLQRFNKVVMRFVGPANRSSMNLRGNTEMTPEAQDWYRNLQDDYEMVRDSDGRSYLRRRDR